MPMAVIGLTGGIASGKSTVAARIRERGVPVIDADLVAREVVAPGQPALEQIRQAFGDDVIAADGTLDRPKLGGIVFNDAAKLKLLNRITHPAIMATVAQRLVELQRAGRPWVCYEAALIVENGLAPGMAELVVVLCDPEVQLRRLMARNDLDEQAARARIASQTDNATRRAAADRVIDNDGSLEELIAATDALVDALDAKYAR